MVEAIVSIILAIISYFAAKKGGASDAQAALVGAGVGAGSYYVGTQTEWGKGMVSKISDWIGVTDANGDPVLANDGRPAVVPKGAEVVRDENGVPVKDNNGNVLWKIVDSAGNVLQGWGADGTAKVVGTAGLVSAVKDNPWPYVLGAGVLFLLIRG